MSTCRESESAAPKTGVTISFGERFAASDQFDAIFKEGMALVEHTARYLDGPGRLEARKLRGPLSVLYATESMRLTTRLLELASWLMIRRALKSGEISAEEARTKRQRVKLKVQAGHPTSKASSTYRSACSNWWGRVSPSTIVSCNLIGPWSLRWTRQRPPTIPSVPRSHACRKLLPTRAGAQARARPARPCSSAEFGCLSRCGCDRSGSQPRCGPASSRKPAAK